MKTIIYYYTGTGNSLWTSRLLAAELGDTTVFPMFRMNGDAPVEAETIGFVFPVHMWGVPSLVLNFLQKMQQEPNRYYFAVAVNAGQVSRTLIQLQNHMASMGLRLSLGVDIVLPSNYIHWGGPGPAEKLARLYLAARGKIKNVAPAIAGKQTAPMEKGPLWQRIVFTAIYKMKRVPFRAFPWPYYDQLTLSQTMHGLRCNKCGEWQNDIPMDYSTGHSADY